MIMMKNEKKLSEEGETRVDIEESEWSEERRGRKITETFIERITFVDVLRGCICDREEKREKGW